MNTTQISDSCVTCPYPNPQASLRLFCFPYAGGSSLIFRPWFNSLPKTVEVCPIELPGRGIQMKLAPLSRLEPLVQALVCEPTEVRQLAPVLHAQGITPTAKNLRKFMQNPSSLWHSEVIEVLKQVRRNLE